MTQSLSARLAPLIAKYERKNGVHYDQLTAFIENTGQLDRRLKVGDTAPMFVAPNQNGRLTRLSDLIANRPLVLVFIRGMWCPYCQEQVSAMGDLIEDFNSAGLSLAVVTPEVGGRAAKMATQLGLSFDVVCDVDGGIALSFGCLFRAPAEEQKFLLARKIDLVERYGSTSSFLPLHSVFGIGRDGQVLAVFGEPDPRTRPEPEVILSEVLRASSGSKD